MASDAKACGVGFPKFLVSSCTATSSAKNVELFIVCINGLHSVSLVSLCRSCPLLFIRGQTTFSCFAYGVGLVIRTLMVGFVVTDSKVEEQQSMLKTEQTRSQTNA